MHDVLEGYVRHVRTVPTAPADVIAHAVLGDALERFVQRIDALLSEAQVLLHRHVVLHAPSLCGDDREAQQEGLTDSFAMIRLADQSIIINLADIERRALGDYAEQILAHEIGHHVLGHRPTEFGLIRKRQEAAANAWAAHTLITPDAYAEAERKWSGHITGMAIELFVADELVLVYQRMLLRTDQAVYVDPRMGAGQWSHRFEVA